MAAREEIQTAMAGRLREMCPGHDYRFSSTGL
jgi:ribosome modulation factor